MNKKPSDAEYRKQEADRDKENQKQAGSFLKYLKEEQKSTFRTYIKPVIRRWMYSD